jgi:hypothetical protein
VPAAVSTIYFHFGVENFYERAAPEKGCFPMSLTPLYVPPSRPSPRPPGEPSRRSDPPVLHRHQAAAIDAERSKLNEERAQLAREKEEFERRQQAVARDSKLGLSAKSSSSTTWRRSGGSLPRSNTSGVGGEADMPRQLNRRV